jgi:hypothetical protein
VTTTQLAFPELGHARKARVVVDFEVPTDVAVHEFEPRGPKRVSGGPSFRPRYFLR